MIVIDPMENWRRYPKSNLRFWRPAPSYHMILETSFQFTIPDLRYGKRGTLGEDIQKILCLKYQFPFIYPTLSTIEHLKVSLIYNGVPGHQYLLVGVLMLCNEVKCT